MHAARDADVVHGPLAGPTVRRLTVRRLAVRRLAVRRLAVVAMVAAVVGLVCVADAAACPNCKDAVNTADPEGLNLARGYFYSILIMLAMPLALVSSFGVYVWRELRRQERLAGAGDAGRPAMLAGGVHPDPRSAAPPT